MLTRLRVSGFKNLIDVEVLFGPFTCIAGPNGIGKSNLFDAIHLLSGLASGTLLDAAMSIRGESRSSDPRGLFHRAGADQADEMTFDLDAIVPHEGSDSLGQVASASATFLNYQLTIGYRSHSDGYESPLEIRQERLSHIPLSGARKRLLFPHSGKWRQSVIMNDRRGAHFISTSDGLILVHQDGGGRGGPQKYKASSMPRTALSAGSASESPTVAMLKREMESWRSLQVEPNALRRPDSFNAPPRIGADGSHLAATLHQLNREDPNTSARVANQLSELIDDVFDVTVDRDQKRELLTLQLTSRDGTIHPARALSDGTLRFLALSIMGFERSRPRLVCLEEPENGIHPDRLQPMTRLLKELSFDPDAEADEGNPLTQVIVNTHSPGLLGLLDPDDVLFAVPMTLRHGDRVTRSTRLVCVSDTWRAAAQVESAPLGRLMSYLYPVLRGAGENGHRRLIDVVQMPDQANWLNESE